MRKKQNIAMLKSWKDSESTYHKKTRKKLTRSIKIVTF